MFKILIASVLLGLTLDASSFKNSLIEEYLQKGKKEFGIQRFNSEYVLLENSHAYKKAKEMESQGFKEQGAKTNLKFYRDILPVLLESGNETGSALPSYIALEIGQHIWLMKNKVLNEKYLADASRALYEKRFCSGYLYGAQILWQENKQDKAIGLLSEGSKNCKNAYRKMLIKKKLMLYKYKQGIYKNKKEK